MVGEEGFSFIQHLCPACADLENRAGVWWDMGKGDNRVLLLGDLSVRSYQKTAIAAHWELFLVMKPLTCPVVLVVLVLLLQGGS